MDQSVEQYSDNTRIGTHENEVVCCYPGLAADQCEIT
jgi:hypothetical protein